ncbi:MAG: TetR/AcrR family transcriptional regulator [Gaiellales bacterium]
MSEPRRQEILAAACRVIGRMGIDRLRMSDVAAEAGVSTALVHYYCATRDELLEQAFVFADERAAQAEQRVASDDIPPAERIERMLLLYLDDEGTDIYENWILWREMANHALFESRLRPALEASYRDWVRGLAEVVREGQVDGSISATTDPESAMWRLTAFVEGLGPLMLMDMLPRRRVVELVREAVALELGLRVGA